MGNIERIFFTAIQQNLELKDLDFQLF